MSERRQDYETMRPREQAVAAAINLQLGLARAQEELENAVDALGTALTDLVEELECRRLVEETTRLARELAGLRSELVDASISRRNARAELELVESVFGLDWKQAHGGNVVDPATGKANVEHTKSVLARAMAGDGKIRSLRSVVENAEDTWASLGARVAGLEDQIAATKATMYLTAAELNLLAGPASAVGSLTGLVKGGQ